MPAAVTGVASPLPLLLLSFVLRTQPEPEQATSNEQRATQTQTQKCDDDDGTCIDNPPRPSVAGQWHRAQSAEIANT
jgi:hypothetical protein